VGASGRAGRPLRLLRARAIGLPDVHGAASDSRAGRRSGGGDDLHARRRDERAGGVPPQRADGVRVDFGLGAYLGPDYTADYLHNAALHVRDRYGGADSDRARSRTVDDFQTNRYDSGTDTLEYTAAQADAFRAQRTRYREFFSNPTTEFGLRPRAIDDADEIHDLTAFFSWSAWAAAARRPGHNYSYTNSWPPEELVDNTPSANVILWSLLSLIALLGGIGLLFAAFGRWNFLGWQGREQATLSFRAPGDVALTPAQRATAWFFFVMAALFLV
jgi:nitric oxide reductase subunit B